MCVCIWVIKYQKFLVVYFTIFVHVLKLLVCNEHQNFSITHKYVPLDSALASVINVHFSKSNVI